MLCVGEGPLKINNFAPRTGKSRVLAKGVYSYGMRLEPKPYFYTVIGQKDHLETAHKAINAYND